MVTQPRLLLPRSPHLRFFPVRCNHHNPHPRVILLPSIAWSGVAASAPLRPPWVNGWGCGQQAVFLAFPLAPPPRLRVGRRILKEPWRKAEGSPGRVDRRGCVMSRRPLAGAALWGKPCAAAGQESHGGQEEDQFSRLQKTKRRYVLLFLQAPTSFCLF